MEGKKFNFKKVVEPHPEEKSVGLPKKIEQEILSTAENSPLTITLERFRQAGIPDEAVERYSAAVHAFAEERPSKIDRGGTTEFSPQALYFAPHITFSNEYTDIQPLAARAGDASLKPKLSSTGALEKTTISGEVAVAIFKTDFLDPEERPEKVTTEEVFMTQLNRFMYFLHEPLHIWQALGTGDRLNRLKDVVGVDTIPPEKEKEYLEKNPYIDLDFGKFSLLKESAFCNISEDSKKNPEFDPVNFIVANNEATMDFMADKALKELLLKNPALLFYLHNSMVVMVEALREVKSQALKKIESFETGMSNERLSSDDVRNPLTAIKKHLDFVSRVYFAAFDTSAECASYFTNTSHEMLGKKIGGKLLDTDTFDSFEVQGLVADTDSLAYIANDKSAEWDAAKLLSKQQYHYPSGAVHFTHTKIEIESELSGSYSFTPSAPMTKNGAILLGRIFTEAAKRNLSGVEIKELVENIDAAASDGVQAQKIIATTQDKIGINLTEENIREMYGAPNFLFMKGAGEDDSYTKEFYLRKVVVELLEQENPTSVDTLLQSCFVESTMSNIEFFILSGVGGEKKLGGTQIEPWSYFKNLLQRNEDALKNSQKPFFDGHLLNAEEEKSIKSFSIFGIDLTQLDSSELEEIKSIVDSLEGGKTQEEKFEILTALSNLKRKYSK